MRVIFIVSLRLRDACMVILTTEDTEGTESLLGALYADRNQ